MPLPPSDGVPEELRAAFRDAARSATPADPNLRWNAARIPVQLRGRTTEDLALPGAAIAAARAFIESFPQRHVPDDTPLDRFPEERSMIGRGLTLTGPHLSGKTSLGCAILTELASTALTICFVPFVEYMHLFNERHAWRAGRDMRFEDFAANFETSMSVVMDASLIMLDDIGQEHSTASRAAADELYRVTRSRHRRGLVTILTTSLAPAQLHEAYSPAMADFMLRSFTHVPLSRPARA